MKVQIISSDKSIDDLNEKVTKWTSDNNPDIVNTTLSINVLDEVSADGILFTDWIEYTIAITYKLTEEQQKHLDMQIALKKEKAEWVEDQLNNIEGNEV